jgi:acyl-coenzyme A synthetase/AMP-(fatty) acid ligase/thioesterase domain-containing protein/acyl carrier protein
VDEVSAAVRALAVEEPARPVLVFEGATATYADLDAEADRLAALVLEHVGSGPARIGVRLEAPRDLLATVLGVLRAGKTLVGIDPTGPVPRAADMLADAGASLLLGHGSEELGVAVLRPDAWLGTTAAAPVDEPLVQGEPGALVYTSGSTGRPKAIAASPAYLDQLSAIFELLGPALRRSRLGVPSGGSVGNYVLFHRGLFLGGCTQHVHDVRRHGLDDMVDWLDREQIEVLAGVPTLLRFLVPSMREVLALPHLRRVISYGEPLHGQDVRALFRHLPDDAVVVNAYGTSETGAVAFSQLTRDSPLPDGPLPVGKPFGCRILVVDEQGAEVPPGHAGEIAVEGPAVGPGYWRRPEMNSSTFPERSDGRMRCLTGDGGSLDLDGVLHHHGRLDDVVKVSGHRVALGEVESVLRQQEGVASAAAVGRTGTNGHVRLHAFITVRGEAAPTGPGLRAQLARRLPPHMLPDSITVLAELPTLGTGKVDRPSLAALLDEPTPSPASLDDDLTSALLALFVRVLELPAVGPDDDFFELGGDSLRVAELFVLLDDELGVDRPLSLLVEAPTARALAEAIRSYQPSIVVPIRTTGDRSPLFVVHGGAGNAVWVRSLAAQLDEDRPVYALRAPALDGLQPREASLEELAARYVAAVRAVQPHGKFHLYGYSLGGVIAWEMARQLEDSGETVVFLGMGDAPSGQWAKALDARAPSQRHPAVALARGAARPLRRRLRPTERERREAVWQAALEASRRGVPVPVDRRGDFVQHVYGELASRYAPPHRDGPTLLVRPAVRAISDVGDWASVCSDLEVAQVPGTHESMARQCLSDVARVLDATLSRTSSRTPA